MAFRPISEEFVVGEEVILNCGLTKTNTLPDTGFL